MVIPFNVDSSLDEFTVRPTAPPCLMINFLVNNNNNQTVVTADKQAIQESNTELGKIVNGETSSRQVDGNIIINGVDPDFFLLVVRFLETKSIKLNDAQHTLKVLEIATRFNCTELVIVCVKDLDLNLTVYNVIDIFRALWYYNSITPPKQFIETKPKRRNKNEIDKKLITQEEYLSGLLNNCLQLIDMNCGIVLTNPTMFELRFEELEMVVKRDTLQMNSEIVLFDFLVKWSKRECNRKGLDLNSDNIRRVLGALCYTPRYLTLPVNDFEQACDRAELLDNGETQLVKEVFKGTKLSNITNEQHNMLANFRKSRPPYAKLPIHLTTRSDPKNYPKKMRKYDRDESAGCCSNLILDCIGVFICIFD